MSNLQMTRVARRRSMFGYSYKTIRFVRGVWHRVQRINREWYVVFWSCLVSAILICVVSAIVGSLAEALALLLIMAWMFITVASLSTQSIR